MTTMADAETLRVVGQMFISMAEAIEQDDEILGSLAGMGLANSLPALPLHIRDVIAEHVSDEAARSHKADKAYMEEAA